jgi:hypothetical protein
MDGFRRYAHARVQALSKYKLFFILKGRILLFYSRFLFLISLKSLQKYNTVFSLILTGNKPAVS